MKRKLSSEHSSPRTRSRAASRQKKAENETATHYVAVRFTPRQTALLEALVEDQRKKMPLLRVTASSLCRELVIQEACRRELHVQTGIMRSSANESAKA